MTDNYNWIQNLVNEGVSNESAQGMVQMELDYLLPWHTGEGHPFDVEDDEDMQILAEKIERDGILTPLQVRREPHLAGRFEVISGHRRLHCARRLNLATVPVIIVDYDDDKATIAMIESNVGMRKRLKPSTLAKAYKMYLEVNNRRGERNDLTLDTECPKLTTQEMAAEKFGKSKSTIKLYARLNDLIPELLSIVDEGGLSIKAGAELSYLSAEDQLLVLEQMQGGGYKMNEAEAKRLRELPDDEFQAEIGRGVPAPKHEKKQTKPKINERFVNTYLPVHIRKQTTEKKREYVQQALIQYNRYLEEHPEEKAEWEV